MRDKEIKGQAVIPSGLRLVLKHSIEIVIAFARTISDDLVSKSIDQSMQKVGASLLD